ncbi:histidinol-phosphate aminotransferase family protein [Streptococcus sp. X16XC17]|uniref:pyridoxal phosphate-dependent aminotransferase n=1 Tax=unclassified Streptococcus TaxID=2608887 RepID=UPI00066FCA4B|nr:MULTISPECIES: histidinol-phosphate transaminase [unclassified Streptococcus]TCD46311.1 histidinol-phosphate aminotransferase family protein [Streptococcus sp. X16XC17]
MVEVRKNLGHFQTYKVHKVVEHNLGDNENRLMDWGFLTKEVLKEVDPAVLSYYGDNKYAELIATYAQYVGVEPNQVVQGVGSDMLIGQIITGFLNHDDILLTLSPDFFMYGIHNDLHGSHMETFSLEWTNGRPDFDPKPLLAYAKKVNAKMILLSNPNNPASVSYDRKKLEEIVSGFDGLVVIDEAYIEFSNSISMADLTDKVDNLIVLRTLSKAFSLAGLRLGFAISNNRLARELDRILPPYSMSNLVAYIGNAALAHRDKVEESVKQICTIRDDFMDFLANLADVTVLPSQTNFVSFTASFAEEIFQAGQDADFAFKYYKQGPMSNYIRMGIGREDEIDQMKSIIREVAQQHHLGE